MLRASTSPTVQELLRCRGLTGTTLFPPSQSASGQAFDVAVTICGLLVEEGRLTTGLGDNIFKLASAANHGGSSQPLEQVLMDFMSLGRRFNWDQLVAFTGRIEDAGTLHALADQVRDAGGQLPVLFSAVALSGKPAAVAKYVAHFDKTGLTDLGYSLRFGAGGVNELLARDQLLYRTGSRRHLGVDWSLRLPWLAFALKWLAYLSSGFLLAASLHFARPAVSSLEQPLQVRGFHVVRESLFALGFLLVVLLLSEPFLAQDTRKEEVCLSTARAHDGHGGPGRIRPQSSQHYEQHDPADPAAVLRAAGTDLYCLPREAGGNPPAERHAAHQAQAARKRRPPVRRRPVPGLRRHHHLADPRLDGGHQIQPDGRLLVHVLRHHLRVRV